MVMLESMAGTGHKYVRLRPRLADKMERVMFDPIGMLFTVDLMTECPTIITELGVNTKLYQ